MKEKERKKEGGNLVFAVNGERFEVAAIDPSTTLLEFLRYHTRFKSVKLGCGEGGCGACVVLLSKYDPLSDQVEDYTKSSCLTLLCSVNGCSITTTEGLGNCKDGFHAIHERIAGFHASQCGFCSPGMCVSLFSALVNADKSNQPDPPPGFSKLTITEAEKAVAGNLCRCTGYRPVDDACKSFAADVDIEDLGLNSFWHNEESKEVKLSNLPSYHLISTFPEFLKKEAKSNMPLDSGRYSWYTPGSIEELQGLLESKEATNMTHLKIIVSNTGTSYYKEIGGYATYIDLKYISELSVIKTDSTGIQMGASLSISKAISALKDGGNDTMYDHTNMILVKIANHLEKIASGFVRNSASIGGNLVMAQRSGFPSDIATVLLAVDALVEIISSPKREIITLEEFFERPPLDTKSIIVSVKIPFWKPFFPGKFTTGFEVKNIQLAFGAYGTRHAIRARKVEEFLVGKTLEHEVLIDAMKLVQATVVPEDGVSHSPYRQSLAEALLFEFLNSLVETGFEFPRVGLNGYVDSETRAGHWVTEKDTIHSLPQLLNSKQTIAAGSEYRPVGEPIVKSGAALQASGEAVYVDDIPSLASCLYGAFIYSTKPLARIKGVHFVSNSLPEGCVALISVKDIPDGGENVGVSTMFGDEVLFADEITSCAGQRIALVVADTQKHADNAAALAVVDYDTENLEPPILTIEDAVEQSSYFDIPPHLCPKPVGDFTKGMEEADHKILSAEIRLPSQYYFYMETQTALAVPDEDNCMVVYSSLQAPAFAHAVVSKCLGVPANNVRVITRRVGGGFGGKMRRSMAIATACALAAHKLQRPVRMYLNRKTDMILAGGRHPMKITYSVGFKSDGKITACHLDVLIDAGFSEDLSPMLPNFTMSAVKKYDWGALSFNIKICKTNNTSKSIMRGPGKVQGSIIAETVIEHVASSLSMDADVVRNRNLHTFESLTLFYASSAGEPGEYTLPSLWDKLASSSKFDQRMEMVKRFNSINKWHKRGISRIPMVYEVKLRPTPGKVSILEDGSIVVEVGGIELGQGLWTTVKQAVAFGLSKIYFGGAEDLLDKVRVLQADTLSMIQGGMTAGSTTSESSCEAARICCYTLVERLTPIKDTLQEQMGTVKWETLISQACRQAVNLSASSYYIPEFDSMQYLNYGAAVSEIEGAFVQGIGFFMLEEYLTNPDGLVINDSTWTYKIPTIDTIPKQINVEIVNSGHNKKRVLSSKASGEPPLLLAASVHCATRSAIKEARRQLASWGGLDGRECDYLFQLSVPATMPVVKELCGLDIVHRYLKTALANT